MGLWNSDFTETKLELDGVLRDVGGLKKYRFATSTVEIFALTAAEDKNGYLIAVGQNGWPTRYFSFNDGKYPYNIAFDFQRGVVSFATQEGMREKKFSDIGIQVSGHCTMAPTAMPTTAPTSPLGSFDCNDDLSVIPMTNFAVWAHGRLWNSDFTETKLELDGVLRDVGGLKKYRFTPSTVEIYALTAAQDKDGYLILVAQNGWPTRHFSF